MPAFHIVIKIITVFLLLSPACIAGDTISITRVNDSDIFIRIPQKERIDSFLKDEDYFYGGTIKPTEGKGFLQKLWIKILRFFVKGLDVFQLLPVLMKLIFIVAFVAIIFFIAKKSKIHTLFYQEQKLKSPDYSVNNQDISSFDLDAAIADERAKQNFRNAVRLLHLKILKELETNKIVRLSIDKTNIEYTHEIKDAVLKKEFIELTGAYNLIWYGKHLISKSEFDLLAGNFQTFSVLIASRHE